MSDPVAPAVRRQRGLLRQVGVGLLWYVAPALVVLAVAGYVAGAVVWHANPPVVPVAGGSMRPTLEPGDLVVLKGENPDSLRKGDIIAVRVPKSSRTEYGLPAQVVHRIIDIEKSPAGPIFHTKGDANSEPDVFVTHGSDVAGRLVARGPGLGYPLLFFRSRQGQIFLAAAGLVAALYFLLGLFEERRARSEADAVGLQSVLAETEQLKHALERVEKANQVWQAPLPAGFEQMQAAASTTALEQLAEEVRADSARDRESAETLRQLVAAVGEYGEHLRSHTAVMQGLAAATSELHRAASELRSGLERSGGVAAASERVRDDTSELEHGLSLDADVRQEPTGADEEASALRSRPQHEAGPRTEETQLEAPESPEVAAFERELPLAETSGPLPPIASVASGGFFPARHAAKHDVVIASGIVALVAVALAAGVRHAARNR